MFQYTELTLFLAYNVIRSVKWITLVKSPTHISYSRTVSEVANTEGPWEASETNKKILARMQKEVKGASWCFRELG